MNDESLSLRPIEKADLPFLRDLANDPVVRANVVGWDWPLSLAGQEKWFERGADSETTRRFIVETAAGQQVGLTGLWDIDWRNRTAMSAVKIGGDPSFRGNGYGRRAVELTMEFAFRDAGLHRLYAQILEFNAVSLAVYRDKLGWRFEGSLRQHVWRDGRYWDVQCFGILSDEWLAYAGSRA